LSADVTWNFGKGAVSEANRISERLRGASDPDELRMVADEERANVLSLSSDSTSKPLAINISNLKLYTQKMLEK
jgi:hypothetical protein